MEDVRAVHGQRQRQTQRPGDEQPRVSVARKHVRVDNVKGLFPVQALCRRQRRHRKQPSAQQLFARVAQRQMPRIIDLHALDDIRLRRARGDRRLPRPKFFHQRHHAHGGYHHDLMAAGHERLRLLMDIKAIGGIVRLTVDHHQNTKLLFRHAGPPFRTCLLPLFVSYP